MGGECSTHETGQTCLPDFLQCRRRPRRPRCGVKVKQSPCTARKRKGRLEVQLHSFLIATLGGMWPASRNGQLTPGERVLLLYTLNKKPWRLAAGLDALEGRKVCHTSGFFVCPSRSSVTTCILFVLFNDAFNCEESKADPTGRAV